MTFNLPDGTVLEGDLPEGNLVPDPVFGLSSSDPKKVAKLAKARSKKEFFEKIWSVGAGVEAMAGRLVFGHPSPEHWIHPPQERTADGGDGRTVASFFNLDSAEINTDLNGWSRRFLLESLLAVDLYLFNGAPAFSVIGYASPEGTHRHNLILSQLRAAAVRQAILDAIVVDPDFIVADGNGDELATRTPVDPKDAKTFDEPDLDGDMKKKDLFMKAHTEQSDQWPKFRKVVIYWWGQFYAKVETTGSQSDQDANQPPPTDPTQPQEAPPDQADPTPVA
jgi:outer membrane protein OmpA-like peptidoglycan-associated protein